MKPSHLDRVLCLISLQLTACMAEVRFDEPGDGGGPTSGSSAGGNSGSATAGTTISVGTSSAGTSGSGGETGQEAAALVAEQCPDVAAEAHFCLTLNYPNQLYAVGPDTGNFCHLGDVDGLSGGGDMSSIAVIGPYVHGCSYDQGVWRAPVLGGAADILDVECEALTEYQGGVLLQSAPFETLEHYDSFESMAGGMPVQSLQVDGQFTRITMRGDTLYAAWHSTNLIERHLLPTGDLEPLSLDPFDDWINGMSVTSDGRIYVNSIDRMVGFDVDTGAQLQVADVELGLLRGLHCWSN